MIDEREGDGGLEDRRGTLSLRVTIPGAPERAASAEPVGKRKENDQQKTSNAQGLEVIRLGSDHETNTFCHMSGGGNRALTLCWKGTRQVVRAGGTEHLHICSSNS